MGSRQILDPEERILAFGIADSVLLQFPGEPLVSVHVDLDLKRKPSLQLHVHEPELPIHEIEVQE